MFFRKILLTKKRDLKKIIRLYQCKFCAACTEIKTSRDWSSNKRAKLFFTEFNVRVN